MNRIRSRAISSSRRMLVAGDGFTSSIRLPPNSLQCEENRWRRRFSGCPAGQWRRHDCGPVRGFIPMDISFILDRLAIGEGIWTADRMARLAMLGFTHIVDVQQEFDDTELARAQGLEVLWNPTD